jgi:hypothetical protein
MNKQIFKAITIIALSVPAVSYALPTIVTDANDLDFNGNFLYAVNFNGAGSQTVGDATFTNVSEFGAGSPAGLTVSGFNDTDTWTGATNLGASADNNNLESIMSSIIWSNELNQGNITAAVTVGVDYRLQLLFSEAIGDPRKFKVDIEEGGAVLSEKSEWVNSTSQGYAMSMDFSATDDLLDIGLSRGISGDTNYHISGFTLEVINVSEPGTVSLFGLALLGLGALRKRKKA